MEREELQDAAKVLLKYQNSADEELQEQLMQLIRVFEKTHFMEILSMKVNRFDTTTLSDTEKTSAAGSVTVETKYRDQLG